MVALQPWFFSRDGARERKLIGAVALLAVLIFFAEAPFGASVAMRRSRVVRCVTPTGREADRGCFLFARRAGEDAA
jgi:hypothetical protein